ncbi:TonB-dependent receptor [Ramlibacter alkalitolerans]|uniref:TonB-dependent receptor n=1 Tax=Ramlibacter alkalitolerans TaxID=2039631 RepID=A0ABS1JHW7_9BURK|nr:TonB-dependent receptor [Ramlibacter alkalitolerans]MBL0423787.1 TonB-dependent receptor [Ramlibacter alkalitolerans]
MRKNRMALALAMAFPLLAAGQEAPSKTLGVVTITGDQPTSLPTQIPATMEGITREQIDQTINATDSEDALKYFPSLLVRKRYTGDYNHAILSSRASGTGNSARSAVYADGILLSNYLGNGVGGLSFPPRWGLVTPEEIARVDVMYGPFSAAYPGNSVGAVVEYTTRMPEKFEAHARASYSVQPFELYNTDRTFHAHELAAGAGNKAGDWAWWFNVNRTDSESQPLTFATRLVRQGAAPNAQAPTLAPAVTGAVLDRNNLNDPWFVLGTQTQFHTRQDHLKAKVSYDITPAVRAAYTVGVWQNRSSGNSDSYLRDAGGQPVFSGPVSIDGLNFPALGAGDFPLTEERLTHFMHGLSVKSHTQGLFDWELAGSLYDYDKDIKRQNGAGNTLPGARTGGAGTIADGSGTGWNTLALKGTWRPGGLKGPHIVEAGVQQDSYKLDYVTRNALGSWLDGAPGTLVSDVGGRTRLRSVWAQDAWSFAPAWKTVLGGRFEHWQAYDGRTRTAALATNQPSRSENAFSPKAALSWQFQKETVIKAALGRAVRFPTVQELYGATNTLNNLFLNDPNLRPERSWTFELSGEKPYGNVLTRLTWFAERTRDAIFSQSVFDPAANQNVSRVQNVGRIDTQGLEFAASGSDVGMQGLDLQGSVTYAHSIIEENAGFIRAPGDTIGKRQPNVPRWRATVQAAYHWNPQLTTSIAARYSGNQFRTLNNEDVNGTTYQGVSKFFVVDLRVHYQATKTTSLAFGIDNVNNDKYWNFHPYPQRTYTAEVKFDL